MAFQDDVAFLREVGRRHVEDLRSAVAAAGSEPRGSALIDLLKQALSALDAALDALAAEFGAAADDRDREAIVEKARGLTYSLRTLHLALPWIESARSPDVRQGFIVFLDEAASAILGQTADVVPTPDEGYMYAVRPKPFRQVFDSVGRTYPDGPVPVVVYYPTRESDSLFLHLLAAHELGHGGILHRGLIDAVPVVHGDMTAVNSKLNEAAQELNRVTALDMTFARAQVNGTFRSWLEEVLCDSLATSYLGPSFLLAMAAFAPQFSGSTPGRTHPSMSFRLRLVLEHIAEMGWTDALAARLPSVVDWLESLSNQPPTVGAALPHAPLVEEALSMVGPAVREVSDLGDRAFRPNKLVGADELERLIEARILPAQLLSGAPSDRRSVIFAGWLYGFSVAGDHPASLATITKDRDLQGFLTKGLEMSAVLQKWGSV